MNIDLNTLRSIATVICFLAFLGIVRWAYSKRNRAAFDEAAQIPFESE
jgi:cytochrome c oxidase cbb3-type subunit IV